MNSNESETKPSIGISECLTNCIVRYDGKTQFNQSLISYLSEKFHLVTICPEVETGLGVPRPPIELIEHAEQLRVRGRDDKTLDVTDELLSYSKQKISGLKLLSGYVFKARSPSCGVMNTPVYNTHGELTHYGNGVFVDALIKRYPALPIIDDSLLDDKQLDLFTRKVFEYFNAKE